MIFEKKITYTYYNCSCNSKDFFIHIYSKKNPARSLQYVKGKNHRKIDQFKVDLFYIYIILHKYSKEKDGSGCSMNNIL